MVHPGEYLDSTVRITHSQRAELLSLSGVYGVHPSQIIAEAMVLYKIKHGLIDGDRED